MKFIVSLIATAALFTLTACGDGGAPRVEAAHQKGIDAAWAKALAGENPSHDCASIKGTIVGTKTSAEAQKTLQACNVDIPARFFLTRLDEVERGDRTCQSFMVGQRPEAPHQTADRVADRAAVPRHRRRAEALSEPVHAKR